MIFEIRTNNLYASSKPDLVLISGLCSPVESQSENDLKRKDSQILGPCERDENLQNTRMIMIPAGVLETFAK